MQSPHQSTLQDRRCPGNSPVCVANGGPVGRTYQCGSCHARVVICPKCDRGQIYCSKSCSQKVRRSRLREAAQRYQASDRGRLLHAERSRRYRERSSRVTHHSPASEISGRISPDPEPPVVATVVLRSRDKPPTLRTCHYCGHTVSEFVRQRPLCRRPAAQTRWSHRSVSQRRIPP
jgi:hypothetical protein